jgi:hypothetical protein
MEFENGEVEGEARKWMLALCNKEMNAVRYLYAVSLKCK